MYKRFTADQARGMGEVSPNQLKRAMDAEHRRIKDVAEHGDRGVFMLHWDYERKALHDLFLALDGR